MFGSYNYIVIKCLLALATKKKVLNYVFKEIFNMFESTKNLTIINSYR